MMMLRLITSGATTPPAGPEPAAEAVPTVTGNEDEIRAVSHCASERKVTNHRMSKVSYTGLPLGRPRKQVHPPVPKPYVKKREQKAQIKES